MAQVHRKLREELQVDVPMIELLKYPTISSLSRRLGGHVPETSKSAPVFEKLSEGQLRLKQLRQGQRGIRSPLCDLCVPRSRKGI